jgi:hypothetical protein
MEILHTSADTNWVYIKAFTDILTQFRMRNNQSPWCHVPPVDGNAPSAEQGILSGNFGCHVITTTPSPLISLVSKSLSSHHH